ncbi:zinc transporter 2 [Trichonephila inaurata madagascariensis]|uniref:Zinc transporter 2 n=1 Tax=Trichonephila inaurata madagascariensis TaxID=2747483 RepID=A0A8X6JCC6_9ARAC|nr:zinc transporter 2 [Trichonephila inaurata madagascariensis]
MLTSHRSYISDVYGNKPNWVSPGEEIRKADKVRLIVASVLCLIFMLAEIAGGILSNSLALITDAAHMLTDFGAFLVSLTSLFLAGRKRTRTMTFGFHRAEVIGALISILSIWLLTGILLYAAVQRIISLDFDIDASIMNVVLTMGKVALSAHIVIKSGENPTEVLKKATSIIYENIDVYEVTLQVEEEPAVIDVQN